MNTDDEEGTGFREPLVRSPSSMLVQKCSLGVAQMPRREGFNTIAGVPGDSVNY